MKLGTIVFVSNIIESTDEQISPMFSRWKKDYKVTPIPTVMGVYVGFRYKPKGEVHYDEDGPCFKQKGVQKVLLVYTDERRNALFADPETTHE